MAPFPNPFKVGQPVRRRIGTLGGAGKEGIVREIVMKGVHECLTVDFGDRSETFIWSTYEPISSSFDENKPSNLITRVKRGDQ